MQKLAQQLGMEKGIWASPRRIALDCLADMSDHPAYKAQMERAGFFEPPALPLMLQHSMELTDYPMHTEAPLKAESVKDQSQVAAVRLLNAAGNASPHSRQLAAHMVDQACLRVCHLFKDPYTLWVEQGAAARDELEWEEAEFDYQELFQTGGLNYYFSRFCNALVRVCSHEQLLILVHEGGLINKLRGMLPQRSRRACMSPSMLVNGPGLTINMLTALWTDKVHELSKQLNKRLQEDEARSLELRQQGNAAFKQGKLHQALAYYWQAAALHPGDTALLNNISLACFKQGNIQQALHSAEESVKADPTVAKSWCRLGDAYRALARWQLAHLAYTAARELAPEDADLQERQADVRSHLDTAWAVEDIPHPTKDMMSGATFRWMGLKRAELMAAMRSTSGDGADFITEAISKHEGESRVVTCMQLQDELDDARAPAVAAGRVSSAWLPPSCSQLKRVQDLPCRGDHWSISWSDTPLLHKQTGLIRHMVMVASQRPGQLRATVMCLGTPGMAAVKRALLSACANPGAGQPERPVGRFAAHRMFPIFYKVAELCSSLGFAAAAKTAAEAQKSATHNDTDWQGFNNSGAYDDEDDASALMQDKPDPNN
ncbi:hypothetical protein COO60DRAFT_1646284 [Scenedesmus sp. NREL 46B-D3]|nr:hypothetical protein COO60DRAFT_1646284 [Scenedesmus sp. NREL 46B-D3]